MDYKPKWVDRKCGDCVYFVDVAGEIKGPIILQQGQPKIKECRRAPPSMLAIPAVDINNRPSMQIMPAYPRFSESFPACSQFIDKNYDIIDSSFAFNKD